MITKIVMPLAGAAYFVHAVLGVVDNSAATIDNDVQFGVAMLNGHAPAHGVGAYAGTITRNLAAGMVRY